MVLAVKNPLANAGDIRDMDSILGSEDPLEESMATHSSILAWRIPWIGAWQATIHGVTKKLDTTEQLNSSSLVPYITDRNI